MAILIVGGSKGIGEQLLKNEFSNNSIINFSRSAPETAGPNITHYEIDVLEDELPDLEGLQSIIYCPGSINLKPISSLKEADFRTDFEINVIGAVRIIKKYAKQLKTADNSSIILFSTVAVAQGMPFHCSVAASKGAIEGLTKSLAAEFAPHIRVNAIAPSITDTPLAAGILRNAQAKEKLADKHPLKRILNASDIADMASFLIGEKASAITGQIFNIDAGLSTLKI